MRGAKTRHVFKFAVSFVDWCSVYAEPACTRAETLDSFEEIAQELNREINIDPENRTQEPFQANACTELHEDTE